MEVCRVFLDLLIVQFIGECTCSWYMYAHLVGLSVSVAVHHVYIFFSNFLSPPFKFVASLFQKTKGDRKTKIMAGNFELHASVLNYVAFNGKFSDANEIT